MRVRLPIISPITSAASSDPAGPTVFEKMIMINEKVVKNPIETVEDQILFD